MESLWTTKGVVIFLPFFFFGNNNRNRICIQLHVPSESNRKLMEVIRRNVKEVKKGETEVGNVHKSRSSTFLRSIRGGT